MSTQPAGASSPPPPTSGSPAVLMDLTTTITNNRMAKPNSPQWLLLVAVFVIATCGLIYELVAGTLASYVLGDSITQFSTIIGVYLFSMGVGSWLSKYF